MRWPVAWYTALAMAADTPNHADLADTLDAHGPHRVRRADEDHVEVGHVRVGRNQVVAEGRIGDATGLGVEGDLLEHRHPDAHDGAADDLAARQLLIEDAAGVDGRHDPRDAQQSQVRVEPDFREPRGE